MIFYIYTLRRSRFLNNSRDSSTGPLFVRESRQGLTIIIIITIIIVIVVIWYCGTLWLIEVIILNLRCISKEKSVIIIAIIQWSLILDKSSRIWCRHVVPTHHNVFQDPRRNLNNRLERTFDVEQPCNYSAQMTQK